MYNSRKEFMTSYHLESACCGTTFEDKEWELECPHKDGAALIYANYAKRQFEVRNDLPGIYRYANWMPICRTLEGSGAPVTYKSEGLSEYLGMLSMTRSWWWLLPVTRRGLSDVCVRRIISRCCYVFRKIIWRQFGRMGRGMIA